MKKLFHDLFSRAEVMPFSITYPDGSTEQYGAGGAPRFNLIFRTEKAMRAILVNPDLGFGEAYMVGDIDLEGPMTDLMTMVMTTDLIGAFRKVAYNPVNILRHLPLPADPQRDGEKVLRGQVIELIEGKAIAGGDPLNADRQQVDLGNCPLFDQAQFL